MGWGIAAGWAIVAGSVLLTIGTGAQARANLAEYRGLAKTLPEAIQAAVIMSSFRLAIRVLAPFSSSFILIRAVGEAALQAVPSDMAARLTQLARLTVVWTVLMAGSVLVLTGSAIQLALTYTG